MRNRASIAFLLSSLLLAAPVAMAAKPDMAAVGKPSVLSPAEKHVVVSTPAGAAAQGYITPGTFQKTMIIVLENTDYVVAVKQPFIASLIRHGALLTNFSAYGHPSLPNYLELIAGSNLGVTTNNNSSLTERHVGDLLEARHLSWKVYAENYPGHCYLRIFAKPYTRVTVPFLQFQDVQTNPKRCSRIANATELPGDIARGELPNYSLYIPDLRDNGHDTGVAYADMWLANTIAPILDDPRFMKSMLVMITFDETSRKSPTNRIATILLGDAVVPGSTSNAPLNHASLLRLVEDDMQLGTLGQGDATATLVTGIWQAKPPAVVAQPR